MSKNPPDCLLLWNWVCDNFIFVEELFAKALRSFENNLSLKYFPSLESQARFDEMFKAISVPLFIYLLSFKLDNFMFKVLYWVILFWYKISLNKIYNTFTVPCEKSKMVSFASSIMNNIVVFLSRSRFAVKLIFFIAVGSASSACCLLRSTAVIL